MRADDPLAPARGLAWATLIVAPFWLVVALWLAS